MTKFDKFLEDSDLVLSECIDRGELGDWPYPCRRYYYTFLGMVGVKVNDLTSFGSKGGIDKAQALRSFIMSISGEILAEYNNSGELVQTILVPKLLED